MLTKLYSGTLCWLYWTHYCRCMQSGSAFGVAHEI